MEVLDTTIANVVLPYIAGGLGVSEDEASWVVTTYLVANAIILTATSFLASRFGRKTFFLICLVLFTISSLMCGLACEPRPDPGVPGPAGLRGRRHGAGRAVDPGRRLPAAEAWPGFRPLRRCGGGGTGGRADTRRVARGQCRLDLVLPDQRAGRRVHGGGDRRDPARARSRHRGAPGTPTAGRRVRPALASSSSRPSSARSSLRSTAASRTTGSPHHSSCGS